jgi:ketosteroid isomerase-like protein
VSLVLAVAASPALALAAATADKDGDAALSALLKAQTQAFSEAGQRGDAATMDRYLDPDVVFTNEGGDIVTKADMVSGATPHPPVGEIKVTHWALRRQGEVATATFIDELTQDFHGQKLDYKFQSTETWAKRPGGWKMIASHTMVTPTDPPAMQLTDADLDSYVGVYQLDPTYRVTIARKGDSLVASSGGSPPIPLLAEARDVLFVAGAPTLWQRSGPQEGRLAFPRVRRLWSGATIGAETTARTPCEDTHAAATPALRRLHRAVSSAEREPDAGDPAGPGAGRMDGPAGLRRGLDRRAPLRGLRADRQS